MSGTSLSSNRVEIIFPIPNNKKLMYFQNFLITLRFDLKTSFSKQFKNEDFLERALIF